MAISDTKVPYEILIRFDSDGNPRGAHCQYLRRVVLDGEVLREEVGSAEPIDLSGFPTSGLMSDTTRDALAKVTTLTARVNELADQVNVAADTLETANTHSALLTKENEELVLEVTRLTAVVEALQAQMKEESTSSNS